MSALKLIYRRLLNGDVFGKIEKHRLGETYFWESLSIGSGIGGKYIYYNHYGSSATRVSLQNLKWILSEIFNVTPEQFLFEYTTYSEYVRIDECYG